VITRRWAEEEATGLRELFIQAHVFVSPDRSHDTYFVQHCYRALRKYFDSAVCPRAGWSFKKVKQYFIGTDGASGHFKSKFTLFTMLQLFLTASWMWEFCAPGHGKGPWDGLAAILKSMLRRFEKNGIAYMKVASDVFRELVEKFGDWKKDPTTGAHGINAFHW
jgi:hypothetical protein